jgi:hypothetical protein
MLWGETKSASSAKNARGRAMTDARELTLTLGGKWHRRYGAAPCPVCQPERKHVQNALTLADGNNGRLNNFDDWCDPVCRSKRGHTAHSKEWHQSKEQQDRDAKVPNFHDPNVSKSYFGERKPSKEMNQKKDATPSAKGMASKSLKKGPNLQQFDPPKVTTKATSFFWARVRNSTQANAELGVMT